MEKNQFSFKKGWGQVQLKDAPEVKLEIMEALNITSRYSWGQRLKGEVEPRKSEVEALESIFKKRGIKQIWGE